MPVALVLSLAFHLALYTLADWAGLRAPPPPPVPPVIEAMLILPEIVAEAPVEPGLEETPPIEAPAAAPPAPVTEQPPLPALPPSPAAQAAPQAAMKPAATKSPPPQFYPHEAVRRGLEGEVLVSVTLDGRGRVIAARLERGCGHAILDEAALVAARTLKSLPRGEREAILPVRFKLQ